MKTTKLLSIVLIALVFFITGCGTDPTMDGVELTFDQEYKDMYINFKYPSEFTEKNGAVASPLELQKIYEFRKDGKVTFVLKIEEYASDDAFTRVDEEIKKIEATYKDVNHKTVKGNKTKLDRYSYRASDSFGTDTLYYVYFGKYSYLGTNKIIKVYMINVEGRENFEKLFMPSFKLFNSR